MVQEYTATNDSAPAGGSGQWFESITEEMLKSFPNEVIESMKSINKEKAALNNYLKTQQGVVFISQHEEDELWKSDDFGANYIKKFGISILVSFSRIGFNQKKDLALAYTGYVCGWKCGKGFYVLLAKENGGWVIQKKINAWTS